MAHEELFILAVVKRSVGAEHLKWWRAAEGGGGECEGCACWCV